MPTRKTSTFSTRLLRTKPYQSNCVILRDVDLDGFNESTIKNARKVLQNEKKRQHKKPPKRPKLAAALEEVDPNEPERLMEEFQQAEDFELCIVRHRPDYYVYEGKRYDQEDSYKENEEYFLKDKLPPYNSTRFTQGNFEDEYENQELEPILPERTTTKRSIEDIQRSTRSKTLSDVAASETQTGIPDNTATSTRTTPNKNRTTRKTVTFHDKFLSVEPSTSEDASRTTRTTCQSTRRSARLASTRLASEAAFDNTNLITDSEKTSAANGFQTAVQNTFGENTVLENTDQQSFDDENLSLVFNELPDTSTTKSTLQSKRASIRRLSRKTESTCDDMPLSIGLGESTEFVPTTQDVTMVSTRIAQNKSKIARTTVTFDQNYLPFERSTLSETSLIESRATLQPEISSRQNSTRANNKTTEQTLDNKRLSIGSEESVMDSKLQTAIQKTLEASFSTARENSEADQQSFTFTEENSEADQNESMEIATAKTTFQSEVSSRESTRTALQPEISSRQKSTCFDTKMTDPTLDQANLSINLEESTEATGLHTAIQDSLTTTTNRTVLEKTQLGRKTVTLSDKFLFSEQNKIPEVSATKSRLVSQNRSSARLGASQTGASDQHESTKLGIRPLSKTFAEPTQAISKMFSNLGDAQPDTHLTTDPTSLQNSSMSEDTSMFDEDGSTFTEDQTGYVTELENTLCGDYDPLDQLLRICKQTEILPFANLLDENSATRKLGEGSYGEVFATQVDGVDVALKIVPFTMDDEVRKINGDFMKTASAIMPEAIISNQLSRLATNQTNTTQGFVRVVKMCIVKGNYPQKLLDAWDLYKQNGHDAINDSPVEYSSDDQLYIAIALANAGTDLEKFKVNKENEAVSILLQIITSLQIAEKVLEFEHRDLHVGNVLINRVGVTDEIEYSSDGINYKLYSNGVVATIIDFTNSRINKDGLTIFLDLAGDTELFEGPTDEYQFEIYREMKRANKNNWHLFTPKTNCFWIHYLSKKLLIAKGMRVKRRREVQEIFDLLLGCDNLNEFMQLEEVNNLFAPYRG